MDLEKFKQPAPVIATPYNQIRESSAGRVLVDYVKLLIRRSTYRYLKAVSNLFPKIRWEGGVNNPHPVAVAMLRRYINRIYQRQ